MYGNATVENLASKKGKFFLETGLDGGGKV